jgi:hypothetical protein
LYSKKRTVPPNDFIFPKKIQFTISEKLAKRTGYAVFNQKKSIISPLPLENIVSI